MRRSRLIIAITFLFVFVVIAAGVISRNDKSDAASTGAIELAGMKLSHDSVREMTKDTMGVSNLDDAPAAGPQDAVGSEAGTLVGNVRTFRLEARPIRWEYRSGQHVAAWGYNGQVPGPALHANEGETIKIEFRNRLPMPSTVHWHGVNVPWQQDGVPGVTQAAIKPGETYSYEFKATPAGTRWYHTHGGKMGEEAMQLDMGLSGALIIAPRRVTRTDVDKVLVLDDWLVGSGGYNAAMMAGHEAHSSPYNLFTINGRAAPDIDDIVVKRGQTVRMRFINASTMSYHPMHVHGHQFRITALDGNPVTNPVTRNVALLAPGETADIEFVADNPGVWMVHCHDLHHADAGMTMLLRYEGFEPVQKDEASQAGPDGGGAHKSDDKSAGGMAGMEH